MPAVEAPSDLELAEVAWEMIGAKDSPYYYARRIPVYPRERITFLRDSNPRCTRGARFHTGHHARGLLSKDPADALPIVREKAGQNCRITATRDARCRPSFRTFRLLVSHASATRRRINMALASLPRSKIRPDRYQSRYFP